MAPGSAVCTLSCYSWCSKRTLQGLAWSDPSLHGNSCEVASVTNPHQRLCRTRGIAPLLHLRDGALNSYAFGDFLGHVFLVRLFAAGTHVEVPWGFWLLHYITESFGSKGESYAVQLGCHNSLYACWVCTQYRLTLLGLSRRCSDSWHKINPFLKRTVELGLDGSKSRKTNRT